MSLIVVFYNTITPAQRTHRLAGLMTDAYLSNGRFIELRKRKLCAAFYELRLAT